ncbi:hypothetical protein KDA11_04400 [Candidatus Saccharibacteria bacterium]|nr:hypothetical protein [Candidatus Saccharibacteria bacterium]
MQALQIVQSLGFNSPRDAYGAQLKRLIKNLEPQTSEIRVEWPDEIYAVPRINCALKVVWADTDHNKIYEQRFFGILCGIVVRAFREPPSFPALVKIAYYIGLLRYYTKAYGLFVRDGLITPEMMKLSYYISKGAYAAFEGVAASNIKYLRSLIPKS